MSMQELLGVAVNDLVCEFEKQKVMPERG